MRKVSMAELEPGFVLARDVEDAQGYKLLKMGTVLSDAQVTLLVGWRIREVWVEDEKAPAVVAPDAAAADEQKESSDAMLESARMRLRKRFEGRLINPWMKMLYSEAEKRLGAPRPWR